MTEIYGGEEINGLVLDIGTHMCKAGYSGDDMPKSVIPSACGALSLEENGMEVDGKSANARKIFAGQSALNLRRDNMELPGSYPHQYEPGAISVEQLDIPFSIIWTDPEGEGVKSPFNSDGILAEWDIVEALWEQTFKNQLSLSPSEYAIMIAEPTHNTKEAREKTVELMFEKFNAPAVFLARNAALSSFATARQTSLMVEAGHAATTGGAECSGLSTVTESGNT